jgi:hypothetical protein
MKTLIALISFFLLNHAECDKKDIYIFRNSAFYKSFFLKIDGKPIYSEKNKDVSNGAYGLYITKYSTNKSYINIYLKINGKDTLFKYDVGKCTCDSLMIGHNDESFVILNENEYPWYND